MEPIVIIMTFTLSQMWTIVLKISITESTIPSINKEYLVRLIMVSFKMLTLITMCSLKIPTTYHMVVRAVALLIYTA